MNRRTIAACIIARDEEERLPDCLASLGFCDEIVLVDSGSTDRTREIAAAAGARVIENPWPGFAVQRNVALQAANTDWVLEIDCDERVSPELALEVQRVLGGDGPTQDLAAIPLRHVLFGRELGPSSKYPEYRLRLLRRGAHTHDESRQVHEGLDPHGPVLVLDGDLRHVLADSWGELLGDWWRYVRLEAAQLDPPSTPRPYVTGVVVRPALKFVSRWVLTRGWRDGWRGVVKAGLDCGSDALVWILAARRVRRGQTATADWSGHYGQRLDPTGPVRVVGVAEGAAATQQVGEWLRRAAARGADVALVTTEPPGTAPVDVRVRPAGGHGVLALRAALDAETQIRMTDLLVVGGGRRPKLALRLLPGPAVPDAITVGPASDVEDGLARAAHLRRSRPG